MESDASLALMAQMLKLCALISAPILMICVVIGLLVSIVQVATQIQESTLTFVPKIIAAVVALLLLGNWMIAKWMTYATELFSRIPEL